tara:strand:+ start:263 stop:1231 length:969 start_codon:yes stop_codon:yes gene_type:complete
MVIYKCIRCGFQAENIRQIKKHIYTIPECEEVKFGLPDNYTVKVINATDNKQCYVIPRKMTTNFIPTYTSSETTIKIDENNNETVTRNTDTHIDLLGFNEHSKVSRFGLEETQCEFCDRIHDTVNDLELHYVDCSARKMILPLLKDRDILSHIIDNKMIPYEPDDRMTRALLDIERALHYSFLELAKVIDMYTQHRITNRHEPEFLMKIVNKEALYRKSADPAYNDYAYRSGFSSYWRKPETDEKAEADDASNLSDMDMDMNGFMNEFNNLMDDLNDLKTKKDAKTESSKPKKRGRKPKNVDNTENTKNNTKKTKTDNTTKT